MLCQVQNSQIILKDAVWQSYPFLGIQQIFRLCDFFSEIRFNPTLVEFYPRVFRKTYFQSYQSFFVIISITEDSQSGGDEIN